MCDGKVDLPSILADLQVPSVPKKKARDVPSPMGGDHHCDVCGLKYATRRSLATHRQRNRTCGGQPVGTAAAAHEVGEDDGHSPYDSDGGGAHEVGDAGSAPSDVEAEGGGDTRGGTDAVSMDTAPPQPLRSAGLTEEDDDADPIEKYIAGLSARGTLDNAGLLRHRRPDCRMTDDEVEAVRFLQVVKCNIMLHLLACISMYLPLCYINATFGNIMLHAF